MVFGIGAAFSSRFILYTSSPFVVPSQMLVSVCIMAFWLFSTMGLKMFSLASVIRLRSVILNLLIPFPVPTHKVFFTMSILYIVFDCRPFLVLIMFTALVLVFQIYNP